MLRVLAILLLIAALWLTWALVLPLAPPGPQVLLFPSGSSSKAITAQLQSAGVVRSAAALRLLHFVLPRRTLKAGEYRFDGAASGIRIFRRLVRGDVVIHTVVVPEGYNIFEIAAAIESAGLGSKEDFLEVAKQETGLVRDLDPEAKSLEGYLFPDTYLFTRTMSMREMAAAMVRRFRKEAQALGLHPSTPTAGAPGTPGLQQDPHQVVTLASIVEKETADPSERPEIASVYSNRLSHNMALAADPTVVYAAQLQGDYRGTIYQSDLQSDSPYNTYRHPGLPPGPIANPGAASLRAAMQPAQTDYLFFVAAGDGSGRHHFSSTFEQHERNVLAYRKAVRDQNH